MVFVELSEARETSPGRLGRASTAVACWEGILKDSRGLVREAVAGKVKQLAEGVDVESEGTGCAGPGREVIINSILARCTERH